MIVAENTENWVSCIAMATESWGPFLGRLGMDLGFVTVHESERWKHNSNISVSSVEYLKHALPLLENFSDPSDWKLM
jgi:hypothetical protein